MKILYVVGDPGLNLDRDAPVGNTVHILSTIKAFRNLGCEVTPFIAGENIKEKKSDTSYARIKKILTLPLVSVFRDSCKILYNFQFYKSYKKYFEKIAPDLIYERYCHLHFGCSLIAKRLKIPYILEINSPPKAMKSHGPTYFIWLVGIIQKWVAKSADAIIVVSNFLRACLIERGISMDKIYVLPNGVDRELFNPKNVKSNVRVRYNLKKETIVGYVGSTSKNQRLDFLVESARKIVETIKNIHFLIVGPFTDIDSFEELIKKKQLTRYFTLTGGVPYAKVPGYILAMDICVQVHSNPHGSPIKIFAYGAMGKAVVAPNFEPIKEVCRHGENILLFESLNTEDFANTIIRFAKDSSLRRRLGDNLKRHISKNYTWTKNAEKILKVYETMSRERGNRRTV